MDTKFEYKKVEQKPKRKLKGVWSVQSSDEFESFYHRGKFYRFSNFMSNHFSFWNCSKNVINIRKKFGVWGVHDEIMQAMIEEIKKDVERN